MSYDHNHAFAIIDSLLNQMPTLSPIAAQSMIAGVTDLLLAFAVENAGDDNFYLLSDGIYKVKSFKHFHRSQDFDAPNSCCDINDVYILVMKKGRHVRFFIASDIAGCAMKGAEVFAPGKCTCADKFHFMAHHKQHHGHYHDEKRWDKDDKWSKGRDNDDYDRHYRHHHRAHDYHHHEYEHECHHRHHDCHHRHHHHDCHQHRKPHWHEHRYHHHHEQGCCECEHIYMEGCDRHGYDCREERHDYPRHEHKHHGHHHHHPSDFKFPDNFWQY